MSITFEEMLRLCREVAAFSRSAGWSWKGLPAIQWEFATISEFVRARAEIEQVLRSEVMVADPSWARIIDPETFEADCYGVTFRLICRQRLATRARPTGAGAAEMIYTKAEDYHDRLNQEHERLKRIRRRPKT